MVVYRIAHKKYKEITLSGIGAEKAGGRWNEIGTRAVYCSENISLALLEYYVNAEDIATLPKDIIVAKILIPEEFTIYEPEKLPDNWDQYPYSNTTPGLFTKLSKSRDFFALKVPSTIIPPEFNLILNPLYRDFGKIEIVEFIELNINESTPKPISTTNSCKIQYLR